MSTSKLMIASTSNSSSRIVPRSRPLPARKQVLFASHRHLLLNNDLCLFLRPGDFSATEWRQLRAAINQATTTSTSTGTGTGSGTVASLTVLRPGLLPALLRDESITTRINTQYLNQPSHLQGPLAVLTCPTLDPVTLSKVLTILNKFSLQPSRNAPALDPKAAAAAAKTNSPAVERMAVLSSLLEKTRVADPTRTSKVIAKLPPLPVLHSQLVGLLSTPSSRITGLLATRASQVGRTLEGFKAGLEEGAGARAGAGAGTGAGAGQVQSA